MGRIDSNSEDYWRKSGYLHRLHLADNPLYGEGASLGEKTDEGLRAQIEILKKKEDGVLESFSKLFPLKKREKDSPGRGIKIVEKLTSGSNALYDEFLGRLESENKENIRKDIGEIAKKGILSLIQEREGDSGKAAKNLSKIENEISRRVAEAFKGVRYSEGLVAPQMGNIWEIYLSLLLDIELTSVLKTEGARLKRYVEERSVIATVEEIKKKSFRGARFTGDVKLNTISKEGQGYGSKKASADIILQTAGRNFLPLQIKSTSKKSISILSKASIPMLLRGSVYEAQEEYIKFAIIHQHMFTDVDYRGMVDLVAKTEGITVPTSRGKGDVIEKLGAGSPSAIKGLQPAIDILRQAVAYKSIAGLLKQTESLLYIIQGTRSLGEKTGSRNFVFRVSDMLNLLTKPEDGGAIKKVLKTIRVDSAWESPTGLKKKFSEATKAEWWKSTKKDVNKAYEKIKITLDFNYADMSKEIS